MPLRVLTYDSFPEGGYPDASKADVTFVSDHLVFDLGMQSTCCWRKVGSSWEPSEANLTEATTEEATVGNKGWSNNNADSAVFFNGSRDCMQDIIDGVIARALIAVHPQFMKLNPAQQRVFATSVSIVIHFKMISLIYSALGTGA